MALDPPRKLKSFEKLHGPCGILLHISRASQLSYRENLKTIRHNNLVMNSFTSDRNMVFSAMKRLRGQKLSSHPLKLVTPVGTFLHHDVLEGFAADAEHLGKLHCFAASN